MHVFSASPSISLSAHCYSSHRRRAHSQPLRPSSRVSPSGILLESSELRQNPERQWAPPHQPSAKQGTSFSEQTQLTRRAQRRTRLPTHEHTQCEGWDTFKGLLSPSMKHLVGLHILLESADITAKLTERLQTWRVPSQGRQSVAVCRQKDVGKGWPLLRVHRSPPPAHGLSHSVKC